MDVIWQKWIMIIQGNWSRLVRTLQFRFKRCYIVFNNLQRIVIVATDKSLINQHSAVNSGFSGIATPDKTHSMNPVCELAKLYYPVFLQFNTSICMLILLHTATILQYFHIAFYQWCQLILIIATKSLATLGCSCYLRLAHVSKLWIVAARCYKCWVGLATAGSNHFPLEHLGSWLASLTSILFLVC